MKWLKKLLGIKERRLLRKDIQDYAHLVMLELDFDPNDEQKTQAIEALLLELYLKAIDSKIELIPSKFPSNKEQALKDLDDRLQVLQIYINSLEQHPVMQLDNSMVLTSFRRVKTSLLSFYGAIVSKQD